MASMAAVANATLFDFDDIPCLGRTMRLPANYVPVGSDSSLTWSDSWHLLPPRSYEYYANPYDQPSKPNTVYNYLGATELSITSVNPFDVTSVEFATLAMDGRMQAFSSASVTLAGYRKGQLVGEITVFLVTENFLPAGFVLIQPNLRSIDTFLVRNDGQAGRYWVMDNLQMTPVPEPAALGLGAGLGLICLSGLRLARRRSAGS